MLANQIISRIFQTFYTFFQSFLYFLIMSIYEQARRKGAHLECTCVNISTYQWDKLMEGHTKANQKEVVKIALQANVIDKQQATRELKQPNYNPYTHYKTKTHVIYVHSGIEHFIKVG